MTEIIDDIKVIDKTYRFKFTDSIMELLTNFSKMHKFACQKDYKEEWLKWCNENQEVINIENERLTQIGYVGDIKDKMYKSARYYFRKKSDEKKEPVKRRQYISIDRELLDLIDQHIQRNKMNDNYTPANGFDDFCKLNESIVNNEIKEMKKNTEFSLEDINLKIKKTYKNRYFQNKKNN